jgi:DNA modification methylase
VGQFNYLSVQSRQSLEALPARISALTTKISRLLNKGVDPFAGSNTTGFVAENLQRRWMAFELNEEYLIGSQYRFEE